MRSEGDFIRKTQPLTPDKVPQDFAGRQHAPGKDILLNEIRMPAVVIESRIVDGDRLENGESVTFLAKLLGAGDRDTAVGFAQLYPIFSSVRMQMGWILNDLFVAPDHRRQGIARALVERSIAYAEGHGAAFVQLETAKDNVEAQSLYEQLGFRRESGFVHYELAVTPASSATS